MSAFPPNKWDVRFLQDMDTLECAPREDGGLAMEAYIAVRPAGGEEGNFKLVLGGNRKLKVSFRVARLLPGEAFADMRIDVELWSGAEIKIEKNSTCSEWWDIGELVSSQDVTVTNSKGADVGDAFLVALQELKKDLLEETSSSEKAGVCLRWILGTRPGSRLVVLAAQVNLIKYKIFSFIKSH